MDFELMQSHYRSLPLVGMRKPVLHKNLVNPVFFAGFAVSSFRTAAAAVAVGMWKPAFFAGFQAPRAVEECRSLEFIVSPSVRHFHSEPAI
jgi:hypothetical protein